MNQCLKQIVLAATLTGLALGTGAAAAYDWDDNPPGPAGGPGTNWENRPGPQGGPGASPNRRRW
jgi:hypothetical protein